MKTITKRIIWDIGLFLVTVMLTFIVTTNMSPKTPVEPAAIVLDTPQPEIVEKIEDALEEGNVSLIREIINNIDPVNLKLNI